MCNINNDLNLWEQFSKTGSVLDYIKYKQISVDETNSWENNINAYKNYRDSNQAT